MCAPPIGTELLLHISRESKLRPLLENDCEVRGRADLQWSSAQTHTHTHTHTESASEADRRRAEDMAQTVSLLLLMTYSRFSLCSFAVKPFLSTEQNLSFINFNPM